MKRIYLLWITLVLSGMFWLANQPEVQQFISDAFTGAMNA